MNLVGVLALVVALIHGAVSSQNAPKPQTRVKENMIASNECMAKGGIGIINTHLYINLRSVQNELVIDGGRKWSQGPREKVQVVVFFENKVWSWDDLPGRFELNKAILVSFEEDKVRFFDFSDMTGGFYRRQEM